MKIWDIVMPGKECGIEVGKCTLLYGQHLLWNELVRNINDFFNTKNSPIKILEGGLPINKSDWRCFFIPFNVEVHLSKITASSPLKDLQNEVTMQLTHSPLFHDLLEIWQQLAGELEFVNPELGRWGIQASLSPFNEIELGKFVSFNPKNGSNLSPLEIKSLLMSIILEKKMDKKTLIIVELPEIYADYHELQKFNILVDKAVAKGYQFLFVSQRKNLGVGNYYFKGRIIHSALLEQIKSKVCNEVPFYCSEILYDQAKKVFLRLVDNSISEEQLLQLDHEDFDTIITIIHVIMYNLDMEPIQVPQALEPNLKRFISDLRQAI